MLRITFIPMVVQGSWDELIEAGNASQTLQSKTDSYTVFAPVTTAIQAAIAKSAVTCQHDFYLDQQCTTLMQLLNSTSLPQLLQNYSKFRRRKAALLFTTTLTVLHFALDFDTMISICCVLQCYIAVLKGHKHMATNRQFHN